MQACSRGPVFPPNDGAEESTAQAGLEITMEESWAVCGLSVLVFCFSCVCASFILFVLFCFLETGSLCVVLAVLKLTL